MASLKKLRALDALFLEATAEFRTQVPVVEWARYVTYVLLREALLRRKEFREPQLSEGAGSS